MKPILFTFSGFNVYSYGLMMAIALLGSLFYAQWHAKKLGLDPEYTFNFGFMALVMGVFGAKLLYFITIFDQLIQDFWGTLKVSITEGFVVYGGVILAVLYCYIRLKKDKKPFFTYFDMAASPIIFGQGIGRIGCLLAGCCYGKPTNAWYGIVFPEGSHAPAGVSLFPSQPVSAVYDLLMAVLLYFTCKKFKTKGRTCALYMIVYGIGRFIIEFFRNDFRGEVGPFSTSQFISLFVVALGVFIMIYAPRFKENQKPETADAFVEYPITEEETVEEKSEN